MNAIETDTKQPAAKKAAPSKKTTATEPAAKETVTFEKATEEIVDAMKDIVKAELGVYGTISDEVSERIEKARKETPKKWRKLVRRGEKVQKDLEKARSDLKKNLEKAQKDLKKDIEKAQKDIKKKVKEITA